MKFNKNVIIIEITLKKFNNFLCGSKWNDRERDFSSGQFKSVSEWEN